jgi:hypothetical protein
MIAASPILEEAHRIVIGLRALRPDPHEALQVHVADVARQHLHLGEAVVAPLRLAHLLGRGARILRLGGGLGGELGRLARVVLHAEMLVVGDALQVGVEPLHQHRRIGNVVAAVRQPLGEHRVELRADLRKDVIGGEDLAHLGDHRPRIGGRRRRGPARLRRRRLRRDRDAGGRDEDHTTNPHLTHSLVQAATSLHFMALSAASLRQR